MEIIKNFGLNPILLVAQIVNFLIIFFILKKLLYKPILDLLNKRKITIQEGIKQAEEARVKLEKVIVEEKNILKSAQTQARKIIEDATNESVETARRLNEEAKKQSENIIKNAKEQIGKEAIEAEKKIAVNVSKLSVTFLEKTLSDFFSGKEQEEIIAKAIKKIKK
ncbi:MAG: F0F1 ATP synthase subunit B [Candidatus Levybacteria bacterium]|nr:F0F1 ATP synthase subunit B [Candidatus Levybacteria bacterium]